MQDIFQLRLNVNEQSGLKMNIFFVQKHKVCLTWDFDTQISKLPVNEF